MIVHEYDGDNNAFRDDDDDFVISDNGNFQLYFNVEEKVLDNGKTVGKITCGVPSKPFIMDVRFLKIMLITGKTSYWIATYAQGRIWLNEASFPWLRDAISQGMRAYHTGNVGMYQYTRPH